MFTTTLRALTIALMITGFGAGVAFAGEVTTSVPGEPGFVDVGLFTDEVIEAATAGDRDEVAQND